MRTIFQIGKRVKDKGFTFVELLIVTLIIVVLSSLAVPRFRTSFERFKLKTIGKQFVEMAKASHELSVLEEKIYRIVIVREPLSFGMEVESPDKESFEPVSGGAGRVRKLPQDFRMEFDDASIYFYEDGSVTGSEVVFSNGLGDRKRYKISVNGQILESSY